MLEFLIPVLIIIFLIFLNGLFVAAEFSIVTAPRPQLRRKMEEGSQKAANILEILSSPEKQNLYITTAQIGITIASLGLGMYGEHVIADWIAAPLHSLGHLAEPLSHTIATVLAVSLLTYFHVVLGEMIPKSYALQTASSMVMALYTPLNIAEKIFTPIVFVLNHISAFIIKIFGLIPEDNRSHVFTPEDLEFIVGESQEFGLIEKSDQVFIENILDLEERTAGHIMTPRNRIQSISIATSPEEIIATICGTNKTRYPIYEESLDHILGVLHIKDIARWQVNNPDQKPNIRELLRPLIFIPETLSLNELLLKFRDEGIQIAIALDEFGGTSGIITLEDLVEEVVGEILDEFDKETVPFKKISESTIRVRGDILLDELEQHFNIKFDEGVDANSIGGFIMSHLGNIPSPGDTVTAGETLFTVEEIEGFAVKSVLIELPPPPPEEPI
ncbi:hemolysin family protein [bacterium]|nr:hemolysin family protein [bacterium]MCB2180386.1 hemolysin family protein [bacterium]